MATLEDVLKQMSDGWNAYSASPDSILDDDEELTDHDELVAELNTLNLLARDIDSLKHTAILLTECDNLDLETAAIWLSALNTYKNTTPKE